MPPLPEAAQPSDVQPAAFDWAPAERSAHVFEMDDGIVRVWPDVRRAEEPYAVPGTSYDFFSDLHRCALAAQPRSCELRLLTRVFRRPPVQDQCTLHDVIPGLLCCVPDVLLQLFERGRYLVWSVHLCAPCIALRPGPGRAAAPLRACKHRVRRIGST